MGGNKNMFTITNKVNTVHLGYQPPKHEVEREIEETVREMHYYLSKIVDDDDLKIFDITLSFTVANIH